MKQQRGFTIMEIMVVVSIIGLLIAIAVPNFSGFQSRSKQAEAKANLAGIYVAEKAYFSEKSSYGGIHQVNWEPDSNNVYQYWLFPPGGGTGTQCSAAPTGCVAGTTADTDWGGHPTVAYVHGNYPSGHVCASSSYAATVSSFTAMAIADVDGDQAADMWVINDGHETVNCADDVEM